jgi:hypothetical protein
MTRSVLSRRSCYELRRHSFSAEIPRWMANLFGKENFYNALIHNFMVAEKNSNDGRIW